MSKDKNQRWAVKAPDGTMNRFAKGRKQAQEEFSPIPWRWLYRWGFRCVKVWVYQEPRELPLRPNQKRFVQDFVQDGLQMKEEPHA